MRILSAAGCILFLASCASQPASPPASWNAVRIGMLQNDVREQLGEPDAILPQHIEPPQDPNEWCLTLSLWKIQGPVVKWMYRSGDEQSLIVAFDYAGTVTGIDRVMPQHGQ